MINVTLINLSYWEKLFKSFAEH